MKKGFWQRVRGIIGNSNLILEIVDARFPEETRNRQLEQMVRGAGKELVIVLNKSDLVSVARAGKLKKEISKEFPCVFVSTKERIGSGKLREFIGKKSGSGKVKVGVVGYPNTGKSSVINYLKGKKAAKTSSSAGFTKGEQMVKISEKIMLMDSPGVIPYDEVDERKLTLIGSRNANQLKNVVGAAEYVLRFILHENPEVLKEFYGVEGVTAEEVLEGIAVKKKRLLRGGIPDSEVAARLFLNDWQKGKLKI
ncbi:MAG: GTPase [Candidatus Diapherotrites archaeon]